LQHHRVDAKAKDPEQEVDMLPPWIIERIERERRRREREPDRRTRLEIEPGPRPEPPPPPEPRRNPVVIEL
jgi:hypothetical protein